MIHKVNLNLKTVRDYNFFDLQQCCIDFVSIFLCLRTAKVQVEAPVPVQLMVSGLAPSHIFA
jgi:hypothetical protein